ncbi:hypothetical protein GW17_00033947 [Ensete ventricosum]|nr:hypothetical protein GW17_00033947 [Ensete ventricosum]RZS25654.1 hypothetical protein BHM03_00058889 [Ensete ventricosum]
MNSNAAMRSRGGGLWEGLYRVLMRRNSVYVTFVVAGAFVGERVRFHHLFLYFLCGLRVRASILLSFFFFSIFIIFHFF